MTVRIKSSVKMDGRIILDRFIPEINLSNNTVAENASIGTVVGTATVQNAGGSTFTFELVDEGSTGDFSMTAGGVISVASALNHEEQSVYPVQIKSVDGRGHKYAIATNLVVGDINEPPVDISLDNNTYDLTLRDNVGKSVAFASAVDPDEGETITWSLGTDASGRFSIDPSTGEISVAGSLASDSYQINVIATDSGSNTYDEDFVISVSALSEQKIQASDKQNSDLFGHSSAISADGDTVIVGTPGEDTGGSSTGAAYIFVWNGSTWVEEAKIQASDAQASDNFGWATDISSDGNTVIVGAPFKNEGASSNVGAAYVFTRSGSVWSQQQKLSGTSSAAGNQFGIEVAISDNGENIVIGERYDDTASLNAGATYVFILSGSTWVQQQKITPAGLSANSFFGRAVDISGNGNNSNTLISSTTGSDDGRGSVFIFTRSGSAWTQEAKIQPTGLNPNDFFGRSVSISEDGNTIVVGAYQDDTNGLNSGSVFIFTRSGTVWTQQQKIQSTDAISKSQFGLDVDITNNGDTIIVGAYIEDAIALDSGAAYIFTRASGVWTEQTRILSSDLEAGDELGFAVSLNSLGTRAVVGARREDTGGTDTGAVYIFE